MKITFFIISNQKFNIESAFINLLINPLGSLAPFVWFLYTLFLIFAFVRLVPDKYQLFLLMLSVVIYIFSNDMTSLFCLNQVSRYLIFFMCGSFACCITNASRINSITLLLQSLLLFIVYVYILNLVSHVKILYPLRFVGKYSASVYYLHAFVISIISGICGDQYFIIVGLLAISIPIIIDYTSKKWNLKNFRLLFFGE